MRKVFDIHIHSNYSDGANSIEEIVQHAKEIGLDGIAITDHSEIEGSLKAREFNSAEFGVIPGIEVSSNEGPGLFAAKEDAHLSCSGCVIQDNQFAGAVVVWDAALDIADSFIEGTTEQENLGGGVGVYAEPWLGGPPTLPVTNTTIQGNPIAGVWLSGQGSYTFSDNTIHGGEGWTRENLTKCGDAVNVDGLAISDGLEIAFALDVVVPPAWRVCLRSCVGCPAGEAQGEKKERRSGHEKLLSGSYHGT